MPFIAIVIGVLLLVVAFNDSMATLAHQLEQDIPGYFLWAVAIAAILGLGFIPGMKVPSRWLIALVALVIVLTNFSQIKTGFVNFAAASPAPTGSGPGEPTAAYVGAAGAGGAPTQEQLAGVASPDAGGGGSTQLASNGGGMGGALASFNPAGVLANFTQSIGFGGMG